MREEVNQMTEPLIKLPSMIEDELWAKIEDQKAKITDQNAIIADQKMQLAGKDAELQSKDTEIQRLQHLVAQLSSK